MKRYATLLALSAFAFAACQDNAPTAPSATARPLAGKGGVSGGSPSGDTPTPGLTSTIRNTYFPKGVTPTAVGGNTTGEGSSDCATYGGAGSIAVKVDGAFNQTVAGYQFTVSGSDQSRLAFTQTSPGFAITAVLVKGGPAYDVYDYSPPNTTSSAVITSDAGLTSPYNGGGNIPTISHYVVCYVPVTSVTKTFLGYYAAGHTGTPITTLMTMPGPCSVGCVEILKGQTRGLLYRIDYTSGTGGTITDNIAASCTALNAFNTSGQVFQPAYTLGDLKCTTDGLYTAANPSTHYSSFTFPAGAGSVYIIVDIANTTTNGTCGDRPYTNSVTLQPGGGLAPVSASSTTWIWPEGTPPACPAGEHHGTM